MAQTSNSYTVGSSGQAGPYSYSFPAIADADIKVSVNGTVKTVTTHYTLDTGNTRITFVSGQEPSTGDRVIVYRNTSEDPINSTFVSGSTIRSNELNENFKQLLYIAQESDNQGLSTLGGTMSGTLEIGEDQVIKFEGATANAHETTLTVVDPTADRTITFPNVTGTVITDGDTDTVGVTMMRHNSVDSDQYTDGSIDTEHIADLQITTAKIAAGAITSSKIGGGEVTTAALADDAITTAKLADDSVTNAVIAANAVDSVHYVDGSIDREHLAADIVNEDKIADNAVRSEHILANAVSSSELAANAVATGNIADGAITAAKIGAREVTRATIANDAVGADQLDTNSVGTSELKDNAVTIDQIADAVIVTNGEQAAHTVNDLTFFTTQAADARYDARYFNISTGDTIKDGQTFPDNDTTIATTAAINDRIVDLVDDVGGFWPIANETSFPSSNPDVNNGAGTIVSIKALTSAITTGSGVTTHTITNGAGSGNNVTITGLTQSTTYAAGFGMLLETTTTLHTYAFHRLQAKATEVSTVSGSITNVNTVAGSIANVNTVASDLNESTSEIDTVATNITNVNNVGNNISSVNNCSTNLTAIEHYGDTYQVATGAPTQRPDGSSLVIGDLWFDSSSNKVMMVRDGSAGDGYASVTPSQSVLDDIAIVSGNITWQEDLGSIGDALSTGTGNSIETCSDNIANIQRLGTADAVADMAILATTDVVAALNTLGTADVVADLNTLGTADVVADMNKLATTDCVNDMNTLATTANVNNISTVAGIASNVTTVAGISSDVTAVAADATDIGTVAGKATEIGRLGTAAAVADMAILGTTDCVADMAILATTDVVADLNTLGTADVVSDLNTLATSDVVSDMNTLATSGNVTAMDNCSGSISNINTVSGSISNVNTTAGSISNVNTTAGSISNVNTVAGSIADVNRYANEYKIASSAPGSPSEGDLWYDSSNNVLKYRDDNSWESIAAGIADVVQDTTPELGGHLDCNNKNLTEVATVSGDNLQIDFGTL